MSNIFAPVRLEDMTYALDFPEAYKEAALRYHSQRA